MTQSLIDNFRNKWKRHHPRYDYILLLRFDCPQDIKKHDVFDKVKWIRRWDWRRREFGLSTDLNLPDEEIKIFWTFQNSYHIDEDLVLCFSCRTLFQRKWVETAIENNLETISNILKVENCWVISLK
jgi:hypothetical protein